MHKFLIVFLLILTSMGCTTNDPSILQSKNMRGLERSTTPEEEQTNTLDKNEFDNRVIEQGKPSTILLSEFMQRWNAISDMYTNEQPISFLEKQDDLYYETYLNNGIVLRVHPSSNQVIDRISLLGSSQQKDKTLSMITSWWQLLLVTNPSSPPYDIDKLFAEIGIGPDADVSGIDEQSFQYGGLNYQITPTNEGFTFEAIYPK